MDREDYGEQITRKPTITEVEVARRKGSAQSVVDQLTKVCLLFVFCKDLYFMFVWGVVFFVSEK